ncbi:MAG: GNAT family N-acetyltransferase [Candidatus Binatia bacterium]
MIETTVKAAILSNADEADAVVTILDAYAREPIAGGSPLSGEVKERLIPVLRDHPGAIVVLASVADAKIGLAICFLGLSTFAARPVLNLQDLVVVPEYRGQGVGRLLLRAVEEEARSRGCCKLTLEVRADNLRARTLYRSWGFRDCAAAGAQLPVYFLDKPL